MEVLLTGYKGFIGQNIVEALYGNKICLIEKEDVEKYIKKPKLLRAALTFVDVILHQGAISSTSNEDYKEVMYYNVLFTKLLIDTAKDMGIKMIFASSASIYGNSNHPQNLYAWSKMISEDYGRAAYPEGFTSLRYFNVYGPHEDHKGNMASIVYQAHKFKHNPNQTIPPYPFKLFPNKPQRDFIYVKDVVSANLAAIEAPTGIYDVGTCEPRGFDDMLDLMDIEHVYTTEDRIPHWYQFHTQASPSNRLPNWKAEYTIERGCADYLEYLNDYPND